MENILQFLFSFLLQSSSSLGMVDHFNSMIMSPSFYSNPSYDCSPSSSSADFRKSGCGIPPHMEGNLFSPPSDSDIRRYTCVFCNKKYKRKGHLSDHVKIHTGERPHKCHICGRGFVQKSNCKMHIIKCYSSNMQFLQNK